jgi:hypothetical protein
LEQQCADDVIGGANETFGATILGRGVRAGQAERDTVSGEEMTKLMSEEFSAVVTLHASNCGAKLGMDVHEEAL